MFLDEILMKLEADAVGQRNIDIFLGRRSVIPTGDGPYLSIIETGGMMPTRKQNVSGPATQQPTAQLIARAKTYPAARAMAAAAYNSLDGQFNIVINGVRYLRIVARQEPTDLGPDDKQRPQIVFNIEAEKQPS